MIQYLPLFDALVLAAKRVQHHRFPRRLNSKSKMTRFLTLFCPSRFGPFQMACMIGCFTLGKVWRNHLFEHGSGGGCRRRFRWGRRAKDDTEVSRSGAAKQRLPEEGRALV
jgi:hypothetical protein